LASINLIFIIELIVDQTILLMPKILILLLIILLIKLLAVEIEIIEDVNGEPISNLDVAKRVRYVVLSEL
jgi:hypothetical protein